MTPGDAIRLLRANPEYADLIRDSYLDENLFEAVERFWASAEFGEVQRILGGKPNGGVILDLGAGNGIASAAFAHSGARLVYALEPDPDQDVGRGAIARHAYGLPIEILEGVGEDIPLPDESVDIVYARQVLHHTADPGEVMRECARVLKPGGAFIACREHVVDNEDQLRAFLAMHPLHQLTGGENAWSLDVYIDAIQASGMELVQVLGPWDTVINAFPAVKTPQELDTYPVYLLKRRLGWLGLLVAGVPGVRSLVWIWLKRPTPGIMYTFVARKC